MNKDKLTLNIRDIALLKSNPKKYYDEKSYSHKPHLGSLPHDRRATDPELLQERMDACDERIKENNEKIKDFNKEKEALLSSTEELEKANEKLAKENEKLTEQNKKDYEEFQKSIDEGFDEFENFLDEVEGALNTESDEDNKDHLDNIFDVGEDTKKTLQYYYLYYTDDMENVFYDEIGKGVISELNEVEDNIEWCTDEAEAYVGSNFISISAAVDSAESIEENVQKIDDNEFDIEKNNYKIDGFTEQLKGIDKNIQKMENENKDYLDEKDRTKQRKEQYE